MVNILESCTSEKAMQHTIGYKEDSFVDEIVEEVRNR